jgi:hypothetical protein
LSCSIEKNTGCKVGKAKYFQGEDMTIQEQQSGEGSQQAPQDIGEPAKSPDKSRRSFAKSGLAASGVLLTLSSRPVLGELICKSPSGFESGNLSFHGIPITCAGLLPRVWKDNTNWPSSYVADTTTTIFTKKKGSITTPIPGTKFANVFSCIGYGKGYASLTMTEVLKQGDSLGAHCVAALLNAASGNKTPVLNVAQVKNIFNEFDLKGYFEPTIGIFWYPDQIVAYLKTTMS